MFIWSDNIYFLGSWTWFIFNGFIFLAKLLRNQCFSTSLSHLCVTHYCVGTDLEFCTISVFSILDLFGKNSKTEVLTWNIPIHKRHKWLNDYKIIDTHDRKDVDASYQISSVQFTNTYPMLGLFTREFIIYVGFPPVVGRIVTIWLKNLRKRR